VAFDCEVVLDGAVALDFDELRDEDLDEALDVAVELAPVEGIENSSSDLDWFKAAERAAFNSCRTQSSSGGDVPTLLTLSDRPRTSKHFFRHAASISSTSKSMLEALVTVCTAGNDFRLRGMSVSSSCPFRGLSPGLRTLGSVGGFGINGEATLLNEWPVT